MTDDGDAFEILKSGQFAHGGFRRHPAGQPALEGGPWNSGALAEFVRGLTGADERTGENDVRKLASGFQNPCGIACLITAFFDKGTGKIALNVEILGFSVAK